MCRAAASCPVQYEDYVKGKMSASTTGFGIEVGKWGRYFLSICNGTFAFLETFSQNDIIDSLDWSGGYCVSWCQWKKSKVEIFYLNILKAALDSAIVETFRETPL